MPETRLGKIDQRAIDELIDWMVDGARPSANSFEIINGMCTAADGGRRADQPLRAVHLYAASQHDRLALYLDARDRREEERGPDRAVLDGAIYGESVADGDRKADLDSPKARRPHDCPHDFRIIDELIADGFTDYLVQPIIYTTGETNAASWSSKARRRLQR